MHHIARNARGNEQETPQQQEVALSSVKFMLGARDWIRPSEGLALWTEVTGQQICEHSLRVKVSSLVDQGSLLAVRAKHLPEELRLKLPPGSVAAAAETESHPTIPKVPRTHCLPSLTLIARYEQTPLPTHERERIPWAKAEVERISAVLRNKPQIRLQIASTNIPIADPQKNVIISIAARLKRALPWGQSITENDLNLVVRDVLRQSGLNGPMTDKQKEQIFQASDRLLKERMRLDIRDGYGDRGLRR